MFIYMQFIQKRIQAEKVENMEYLCFLGVLSVFNWDGYEHFNIKSILVHDFFL